jgi:hypothetical protein
MIARLLSSLPVDICLAGAAQAQTLWSTTANSCVPDDDTIKAERYKVNLASVQHATDNVGMITVNCPVTRFSSMLSGWRIGLAYRDSTGTGAAASVRARLYRMVIGQFTPAVIAEVNSNAGAATGNTNLSSSAFTHVFEFGMANYWIRVDLDRSALSETVIFHSVAVLPDD